MDTVSLIGVDLGKHCLHLHGQDASGAMVFRKKLTRSQMFTLLGNFPSCAVAMEACAGAHWIARRLQTPGHETKLFPAIRQTLPATQQERFRECPGGSAKRLAARACVS